MASIRNLKDNGGNVFYPLTHERAVKDSNGVSLESKLAGLESKSYVEAWDGASTPVVANIPAGVTVTYNTTTYTGTLAASADTIGKIYLVKNGNDYDRYITSQSGSSYSWVANGTTAMDLSGYATDAELGQLEAKVDDLGLLVDAENFSGTNLNGWYTYGQVNLKKGVHYVISVDIHTTYAGTRYFCLSTTTTDSGSVKAFNVPAGSTQNTVDFTPTQDYNNLNVVSYAQVAQADIAVKNQSMSDLMDANNYNDGIAVNLANASAQDPSTVYRTSSGVTLHLYSNIYLKRTGTETSRAIYMSQAVDYAFADNAYTLLFADMTTGSLSISNADTDLKKKCNVLLLGRDISGRLYGHLAPWVYSILNGVHQFILAPGNVYPDINLTNGTITFSNTNVKYNGVQYSIDGTYNFTGASSSNKEIVFNKYTHAIEIINQVSASPDRYCLIGSIVYYSGVLYSASLPFEYTVNGGEKPITNSEGMTVFSVNPSIRPSACQNGEYETDGFTWRENTNAVHCPFFFNVENGKKYILQNGDSYYTAVYYYDKSLALLSYVWFGASPVSEYPFFPPVGAAYARFAFRKTGGMTIATFAGSRFTEEEIEDKTIAYREAMFPQVFVDHFFMDGTTQWAYQNNAQTIPAESLFNIEIAKRLGFKTTEASVHETSDGEMVVIHGENGKFGYQVVDLNGQDTYAQTAINTVTLKWIKDNLRYHSTIAKYRVAPPSLDEWLQECKKLNMIPFLAATTTARVEKIMAAVGEEFFMSYRGDRKDIKVPIQISDIGSADVPAILSACRAVGKPCIYGVATTSYTDIELKSIVDALHKEGFLVGWSANYSTEQENQRCLRLGFDWATSGWNIPDFGSGNLCNLFGDETFTDFRHNGSVSGGVLTLPSGDTLSPNIDLNSVFLGGGQLYIRFTGTIRLIFGKYIDAKFSSDGSQTMWFSTAFIQRIPTFAIIADGTVEIVDISYKASKM